MNVEENLKRREMERVKGDNDPIKKRRRKGDNDPFVRI